MGWATDGGEDVGGQAFDYYEWLDLQEELAYIKEDRKDRVRKLAGKYIVCVKGKSSGKRLSIKIERYQTEVTGLSTLATPWGSRI